MINYSRPLRCMSPHHTAAIIGAGVGIASLGYGIYKDANNASKANAIQKNLKTPTDVIPPEFYQNREIAKQMAQVGLPQQQYNNNLNNINQTQAGALASVSRSANPGAGIASIVRQGDQAKNTLDAEDAQARQNNQRYFIQQNAALGTRKDQQEQTNVFDPYTRDFNQMQAYRGAANTQTGDIINAAGSLGNTMLKYKDQYPDLFGSGGGSTRGDYVDPGTTWGSQSSAVMGGSPIKLDINGMPTGGFQ